MAEIRNENNDTNEDIEWNNLDNFITDFARNNENVSLENETRPDSESKKASRSVSGTDKSMRSYTGKIVKKDEKNSAVAEMSKKLLSETDENFSGKYKGLQSDIKNLLVELQEIKRARLDLQSKLDSIR